MDYTEYFMISNTASYHWIEINESGTNLNLTDMECCYKVFRKEILAQIKLRENRFGFEPEVTAKIVKLAKKNK